VRNVCVIDRFFLKAVQLRYKGLGSVYSRFVFYDSRYFNPCPYFQLLYCRQGAFRYCTGRGTNSNLAYIMVPYSCLSGSILWKLIKFKDTHMAPCLNEKCAIVQ
jgi:hypothetical protein